MTSSVLRANLSNPLFVSERDNRHRRRDAGVSGTPVAATPGVHPLHGRLDTDSQQRQRRPQRVGALLLRYVGAVEEPS